MDAGQTRVEDYDLEIMRELAEEVPVILVFTQVIDDERADGLEAAIRDANLRSVGNTPSARSRSRARSATQTLAARGLEELVQLTNDVLPEAVRRAFVNAQGVVDRPQGRSVAGGRRRAPRPPPPGAAAAPVPMSDALLLRPIQLGMLAGDHRDLRPRALQGPGPAACSRPPSARAAWRRRARSSSRSSRRACRAGT